MITSRQLNGVLKALDKDDAHNSLAIKRLNAIIKQAKDEERKRRDPLWFCSKKKFPEPRTVTVEVSRTGVGNIDIEIEGAISERDAAERALDEAGNHSYSDHDSEYEVQSVS